MIDLQNFFDGLFLEIKITHARLSDFAKDCITKLMANNPGSIYDGSITATTIASDNFFAAIGKKKGDKGTKKADTSAKGAARIAIEVFVGNKIGFSRDAFGGKKDPRFIETFPELMVAFYQADDTNFDVNVGVLIEKVTKYVLILGSTFLDDLTTLFEKYSTASTDQGTGITAVNTDITNEDALAMILSDQLTANLLLIARNNRGSLTAKDLYFNVPLLYSQKRKKIKKGTPEAHTDKDICEIEYAGSKHTKIQNKGAVKLIFGMKLLNVKVGREFTVLPNETINPSFLDYFTNGDTLYVINPEDSIGMYQMDIIS